VEYFEPPDYCCKSRRCPPDRSLAT